MSLLIQQRLVRDIRRIYPAAWICASCPTLPAFDVGPLTSNADELIARGYDLAPLP